MNYITNIEDLVMKNHRHFFYDRANHIFNTENLKLEIEPIVFGNDMRNGVSYKLYQNDDLICDIGCDYDGFRYCDYEKVQDEAAFLKDLKLLEKEIDTELSPSLTEEDFDFISLIEQGDVYGFD